MKIGVMYLEEARVFDGSAGEHLIRGVPVTIYWEDGKMNDLRPGWHWYSPSDGAGPFSTSFRALSDAEEAIE